MRECERGRERECERGRERKRERERKKNGQNVNENDSFKKCASNSVGGSNFFIS